MTLGLLIILTVVVLLLTFGLTKLPGDPIIKQWVTYIAVFVVVILWLVWLLNFLGMDTGNIGRNVMDLQEATTRRYT